MPDGYCTVDDVRRVLQESNLSGALDDSGQQIVQDAITGVSGWVERVTHRHWYEPDGIDEDSHGLVATGVKTRDDEHDIPTHGGFVHGASEHRHRRIRANSDALLETGPRHDLRRRHFHHRKEDIRIAFGDSNALVPPVDESIPAYTRITFDRKDVTELNELHVVNENGGFDDWADDADFDGGVGNSFRGDDYWVRVNNRGVSELYLNVHAMDDDIASFANAVYVDIDYGKEGLPMEVRRGVAQLVASELVLDDEAVAAIPDSGQLVNVETKAQRWERQGLRLLEPHLVVPIEDLRLGVQP